MIDRFKNWKSVLGAVATLALVSIACGLVPRISGQGETGVGTVATRTPMPTFTPTSPMVELVDLTGATPTPPGQVAEAGSDMASDPAAEDPTPTPEEAAEPTPPPPTDTPAPARPVASATANVNVRTGPGTNYPAVGSANAGQTSEVTGRNQDASWLQVVYPDGPNGRGWVSAQFLQVNGDVSAVPVVQVDPPPVANNPPPANHPPSCEQQYAFCPAGWFTDHNEALVHFRGVIKNTSGGGVNGFSVRISNGSFSLLSFPSGPSSAAPDWHAGKWDIALTQPPIAQYFGTWTIQVVRYDCAEFFNAQCDQFTPLSEAIPISIEPGAEVIVADWVCNRDCDSGIRR